MSAVMEREEVKETKIQPEVTLRVNDAAHSFVQTLVKEGVYRSQEEFAKEAYMALYTQKRDKLRRALK